MTLNEWVSNTFSFLYICIALMGMAFSIYMIMNVLGIIEHKKHKGGGGN